MLLHQRRQLLLCAACWNREAVDQGAAGQGPLWVRTLAAVVPLVLTLLCFRQAEARICGSHLEESRIAGNLTLVGMLRQELVAQVAKAHDSDCACPYRACACLQQHLHIHQSAAGPITADANRGTCADITAVTLQRLAYLVME